MSAAVGQLALPDLGQPVPYPKRGLADRAGVLRFVEQELSAPPPRSYLRPIERPGRLVCQFLLPLKVCKTTNRTRHAQAWELAQLKKQVFLLMRTQFAGLGSPLEGRPHVQAVRFSSNQPDACSDWAKIPVDMLCAARGRHKMGLNVIRDDAPEFAEVRQDWRPAKRGQGFVYLEVRI